ncbi:MAG: hypothetical protein WD073_03525 [Xanthobacteraceae bacterium]
MRRTSIPKGPAPQTRAMDNPSQLVVTSVSKREARQRLAGQARGSLS